jgi:hypothetical protein
MGKARRRMCAAAVVLCCVTGCRIPFFPHIGKPDDIPSLRATPGGVITQLINSYEQRRLDLFEDLLPSSGTFRFYVSPSFVPEYQSSGKSYVNPAETRDTLLYYIGAFPYYYYWTQDVEVQSHRRLFAQAMSIRFALEPRVDPADLKYIVRNSSCLTARSCWSSTWGAERARSIRSLSTSRCFSLNAMRTACG